MLVSVGKLVSCYFVIYCTLSTVTSFCYAVCCILFIIYQFPIVQSILFRFYVKRIVVSVQENLYHLQKVTSRISFVTSFCNVQFYMQLGAGAPSCSSVASQLDKALFLASNSLCVPTTKSTTIDDQYHEGYRRHSNKTSI